MFRKLADEAFVQYQQAEEAAQKERKQHESELARRHFATLVNNACEPRAVSGNFVEVGDGITLFHCVDLEFGQYHWQVEYTCPKCNLTTLSIYCYNLADIGKMLKEFQPIGGNYNHTPGCVHFTPISLMP